MSSGIIFSPHLTLNLSTRQALDYCLCHQKLSITWCTICLQYTLKHTYYPTAKFSLLCLQKLLSSITYTALGNTLLTSQSLPPFQERIPSPGSLNSSRKSSTSSNGSRSGRGRV